MLAGGVAVLAGGVAGEPGVELCPALLDPPAGAVPPAELWATTQPAQHKTIDSNVRFRENISRASRCSFQLALFREALSGVKVSLTLSHYGLPNGRKYPAYALEEGLNGWLRRERICAPETSEEKAWGILAEDRERRALADAHQPNGQHSGLYT